MVQQTIAQQNIEDVAAPRVVGRVLNVARVLLICLALCYGVLMVLGTPLLIARYSSVDATGTAVNPGLLTDATLRSLPQLGLTPLRYAFLIVTLMWLGTLICWVVGAALLWKRPGDPVALLFALACLLLPAQSAVLILYQANPAYELPLQLLEFFSDILLILGWTLFPDGRWVPRWSRWVALACVVYFAGYAFGVYPSTFANPWVARTNMLLFPSMFVYVIGLQVYRFRRVSTPLQRQQTKWVVAALCLQMAALLLTLVAYRTGAVPHIVADLLNVALSSVTVIAIGLAILRFRLFDIDIVIERTLVYGGLTVGVLGLYVLTVGGLGALIQVPDSPTLSLLATGVVAVLFQPMRLHLQRGANRMLYGRRDEPFAVIAQIGQQIGSVGEPSQLLAAISATLGQMLRLPEVTIVTGATGPTGTHGAARRETALPAADHNEIRSLAYQGQVVGTLHLKPRTGESRLSGADRRLLDNLAPFLGIAIHSVLVNFEIQRARERAVAAREDERRRLRRDLHDGLGPQLAGQAFTLDLAVRQLHSEPEQVEALLKGVRKQTEDAIALIRELVYGLRPPALDDLGLLGAIRAVADRLAPDPEMLRVEVQLLDELPALPAAVEVAIFRIAQEALTNVARHAHARTCRVRMSLEEAEQDSACSMLCLEVVDDGSGTTFEPTTGVGLLSMRERAEELGGHIILERPSNGGSLVRALLPLTQNGEPA